MVQWTQRIETIRQKFITIVERFSGHGEQKWFTIILSLSLNKKFNGRGEKKGYATILSRSLNETDAENRKDTQVKTRNDPIGLLHFWSSPYVWQRRRFSKRFGCQSNDGNANGDDDNDDNGDGSEAWGYGGVAGGSEDDNDDDNNDDTNRMKPVTVTVDKKKQSTNKNDSRNDDKQNQKTSSSKREKTQGNKNKYRLLTLHRKNWKVKSSIIAANTIKTSR